MLLAEPLIEFELQLKTIHEKTLTRKQYLLQKLHKQFSIADSNSKYRQSSFDNWY